MRIPLQPAFLLHSRPYRETSVLLEFFTKDYGRIAAVARGVRTNRSQLKALLQPFTPLLISWQGKSDLMALTGAEANGLPLRLRGDCLLSGFYLNELLLRLLQKQDPYTHLYTVYHKTLVELQAEELQHKTLRLFEKNLLEELGFGLQLGQEAEAFYHYYHGRGFVRVDDEDFHDAGVALFSGKNLLALQNETLNDAESLQDAKRLMRIVFSELLGSKPLQSRKLFIEV